MNIPVFLDENGLTSTSANHIANMAKELVDTKQDFINNLNFVNEKIGLIGVDEYNTLRQGQTINEVKVIEETLEFISQAHSLIAWLREAIKAKEELSEKASLEVIFKDEFPDVKIPETPRMPDCMTEDEYYDSLSIKERNRYYSLEAKCAVYGKAIHPTGTFSKAIREVKKAISKPCVTDGEGRDTTLVYREPSVQVTELEPTFFELQAKHRSYQAELNSMKHDCQEAIFKFQQENIVKYREEFEQYKLDVAEYQAKFQEWVTEQTELVSNLKIVIPDSLKTIYEKVNTLGKLNKD